MENIPKQTIRVFEEGRKYETTYTPKYERRKAWVRPNPEEIKSFLPGTVEKIMVKVGEKVTAGQELMIYTAMKMHNIIRAPFAGTVSAIPVDAGSKQVRGAVMMLIHQEEDAPPKKKKKNAKRVLHRPALIAL